MSHILNGSAEPIIYEIINQSTLIGLAKPGSDKLRPIAMANMFNKWSAKCYIKAFQNHINAEFAKDGIQLGGNLPNGTCIIGILHNMMLESKPDWVSFCFDMSNAFNSVHRDSIFKAVHRVTPEALPMIGHLLYNNSELWIPAANETDNPFILSQEGCRQGDSLSPILFCLAIMEALREIKTTCNLKDTMLLAYMDDISGRGPYEEVKKYAK